MMGTNRIIEWIQIAFAFLMLTALPALAYLLDGTP